MAERFAPGPRPSVGLGLRMRLLEQTLEAADQIDFLELMVDDWLPLPPREAARRLAPLREALPMVAHGIGLSIGSAEGIDRDYVDRVARLLDALEIEVYTEHLSFRRAAGRTAPQFLPLGFDAAHVEVVCRNLETARQSLGRLPALENVAWLLGHADQGLGAAGFVAAVLQRSDCGLLLDLSNLLINAANHGFDPDAWLATVGTDRVVYAHVAGGHVHDGLQVDSHGHVVPPAVHRLLGQLPLPAVLLERDQNLAGIGPLLDELADLRGSLQTGAPGPARLASAGLEPRAVVAPPPPALLQPALVAAIESPGPWSSPGPAGPWLRGLSPAAVAAYRRTMVRKRREALVCAAPRTLAALGDAGWGVLDRWQVEAENDSPESFLAWVSQDALAGSLARSAARHEHALLLLREAAPRWWWAPRLERALDYLPAALDGLLQGHRPRPEPRPCRARYLRRRSRIDVRIL